MDMQFNIFLRILVNFVHAIFFLFYKSQVGELIHIESPLDRLFVKVVTSKSSHEIVNTLTRAYGLREYISYQKIFL